MFAKRLIIIQQLVEVVARDVLKIVRRTARWCAIANFGVPVGSVVGIGNVGTEVGREFEIFQKGDLSVYPSAQYIPAKIVLVQ